MAKSVKREPNIKTFVFVENWLNEILGSISGYMDNKKLLVMVIIKRFYEEFENLDLSDEKVLKKFAESILADIVELEPKIPVKIRLSGEKKVNRN